MIPSKMKIHRVMVGKSQLEIERDSGIPQWKISLIERGLPPNPDEAAKIANALGVKPAEIFPKSNFE